MSQSRDDSAGTTTQAAVLPDVVIEAPDVTTFVKGLVNELIALGYDASATEMAKEDLPGEGTMFFQFTDPTPTAARILSQVESVAKRYCWNGAASLAQMNEASAAIVISYANSTPANCPGTSH